MSLKIAKDWFVYMIETDQFHLYTGVTTDVERRFLQHCNGRGAKFFRMHIPKKIVYIEKCESKETALKKEKWIKQLSPSEKKLLVK